MNDPYAGDPFPSGRPRFQLPDTAIGLVSNSGSDTLTLLDLEARAVIGEGLVGLDPVEIDGPHHVAVDRPAGVAFTALSYPPPVIVPGPHAAHGSSQRPGVVQKLALDDFSPLAEALVDVNPGDVVLSDDGRLLWVSHFDLTRARVESELVEQRSDVIVMDAETLEQGGTFRTCIAPHGIALSRPGGELAFVACYGEDALAVIEPTLDEVPKLFSIGPGGAPGSPIYGPYAAVLSPDQDLVAVSNTTSLDVRFFDVDAREFLSGAVPMPGEPYFPAWSADGERLYVPTQGVDSLVVVQPETAQSLDTRSFEESECVRPHAATLVGPETLYLVCEGDHENPSQVLVLDAETLEITDRLDVGVYPDGLAVAGAP